MRSTLHLNADQCPAARRLAPQAVTAAGCLLMLLLLLFAGCGGAQAAKPLNPNDDMTFWKPASAAQKLAAARQIVAALVEDGTINIGTDRETLAGELLTALDETTDADTKAYVSPGQSMLFTSQEIAYRKKWHQ